MKGLKKLFMAALALPLMTSCLEDGFSQSGFTSVSCDYGFANTTNGFAGLYSLGGKWQISQNSGGEWCTLNRTSGSAKTFYTIGVTFEPNLRDTLRAVQYVIRDLEDDGMASFVVYQFGTRGDGSYGSSPLVKSITGDDGSKIDIAYNAKSCPLSLQMSKNGEQLYDMTFSYNSDSTITIRTASSYLSAKHNIGYMPKANMVSSRDSLTSYISNIYGETVAYFAENRGLGTSKAMTMLFKDNIASFEYPNLDKEHTADSLKYVELNVDGDVLYSESAGLEYTNNSNRRQSVDVNQLLFGIEKCCPYTLLSLYRYTRSSKIISTAKTATGNYTVEPVLNADLSVASLAVTDKNGAKITYTFEYHQ